tara:strand:- start:480 stop:2060 length:1581 start_codon:yes stop_codon:yes gene_type:complete
MSPFRNAGSNNSLLIASLKQLVCCVIFGFAIVGSYFLSRNMEAIDNTTSWYLPAGVRLLAYWYTDKKYWPSLLIGEYTIHLFFTMWLHHGVFIDTFALYLDEVLDPLRIIPPLVTMSGVLFIRARHLSRYSLQDNWWLIAIVLATTFMQSFLRALIYFIEPEFSKLQVAELTIGYWIGDFIGCCIVLSVAFILTHVSSTRSLVARAIALLILISFLVSSCELFNWITNTSNPFYLFKLLTLLSVPVLILIYNLQGAMLSLLGACIALVILQPQAVDFWDLQIYVLALAISGLLTGSAFEAIQDKTKKLGESVVALERTNADIKRLTQQLSTATEKERDRLAQELHDDVGQSIIGLKTEVKMGEKLGIPNEFLQSLKIQIDQIYTSVYQILFQLKPKELEDVGIVAVLKGDKFCSLLNKNSIEYIPNVNLSNEPDKEVATELFRITQEAINNVIKHSAASKCIVELRENEQAWLLSIKDNGKGFNPTTIQSGLGLQSMQDRTNMLGGHFTAHCEGGRTVINIQIPKA